MSGDVQPRKRKDKKRKKDDSCEQIPSQTQTPLSTSLNEDVNIHVHKEDGTGGGICAKIIFFLLFSALAVLIGLIITEHRGVTDLDTADQESRFSQFFEGWIDTGVNHEDDHDDHDDHIVSSLEDDHDDEHDEDEDEFLEEDHDDEHDDKSNEEEEREELSEEVSQEDEKEDSQAEDEEASQAEDEEGSQIEDEEDEEDENSEDDEQTLESEEQEVEDDEETTDVNESGEIDEEAAISKESEKSIEEDEDNEEAEEGGDNEEDEEEEEEEEDVKENGSEEENVSKESQGIESEEAKDEEKTDKEKEEVDEETKDDKVDEEAEEQNNSKMVVKIGVGVALLVVAHVVLVKKWKSASSPTDSTGKETPVLDLSRRNTIVVPPTFQEIERDIEDNAEEEYSDEDGEVDSDEDRMEPNVTKLKYQELRTTYTRSLTPESEPEYQTKKEDADEEDEYEDEEDEEVGAEEEEEDEEEEEEEDSDGGQYEKEDDDEELLKRLEAKYGKLQDDNQAKTNKHEEFDDQFSSWKRVNVPLDNEPEESDSEKQSGDDFETYEYENITNKDDFQIKEKIDEAQKNIKNHAAYAIKMFDALLQKYPSSPRTLYGKAQALDVLADQKRSNEILQKAIALYLQVLNLNDVPNVLYEIVADRCINRLRFMGNYNRAIDVHKKLIARFPDNPKYQNQLAVSYLTINRVNKARVILQQVLAKHPNDGFALVHYGFILKTVDNVLSEAVSYLKRGIATKEPGVIDGRFYFHLGDALARLGRNEEALKVYEEGVEYNLFLSKYQRSLYNVPRLEGKPWWKKEQTPYADLYSALEINWEKIRDEGLAVLKNNNLFQNESENLKNTGDWKQFELFARGQKNIGNCKKCPLTCKIIESVPDARGCRRGQTKFSVMHPGTHVWPHCGPTNCRLRVHLGLQVPEHTYIRVANEIRSWENGKVFIFDDSFEHEVWHNGTTLRLVLIVDVWHPQLTSTEKRNLSPI